MKYLINSLNILLIVIIFLFISAICIFFYFGKDLPDFQVLKNYEPPVVSKIFASNGKFLEEYSRENRIFSSYEKIPDMLVNSFIVAEDKNFFNHGGFDLRGIVRAFTKNIYNFFGNKRPEGASTITQQVAKNVLLSNEVSYSRKIKEIILSMRIEKVLSKQKILELYLNEIYLGNRSYGIASASSNYFNKSLDELNLEEMAMLAALPKAPSTYNPFRNPNKALKRRNWVINRLFQEDLISDQEFNDSINKELVLKKKEKVFNKKASFFKEAVRREIINQYDEQKLYDQGLSIMSTLDTEMQMVAEEVFEKGIIDYDRKFKWRGPIHKIQELENWQKEINLFKKPKGLYNNQQLAVALKVSDSEILIGLNSGKKFVLKKKNMNILDSNSKKKKLKLVFNIGDLIVVEKHNLNNKTDYVLSQVPEVNGGLVVIENNSGRILAMVGGFDSSSAFNRVTQAFRQPGSAFKPIVYLAALENKISPITKILDAPVVIKNPTNNRQWRPTNYGNKFYGMSTLRLGIEKSRNLMTVRLAQKVGLKKIKKLAEDFDIYKNLPILLSSSLGSVETTLQKLTLAYSVIANGGFQTKATLVDQIYDKNGNVIYRHDKRKCLNCIVNFDDYTKENLKNYKFIPEIEETRKRILSEESCYQMTSLLMGVLKRGTAKNINYLDFQVAGKTGTTNNNQDAWFIGYNSDITVGVYVGYDAPKSLGSNQTGSNVAAPIFGEFMKKIYKNNKPKPFKVPNGIKFVNIDITSGFPSNTNFIQEAFKKDFDFEENINQTIKDSSLDELKGFY